MDINDQINAEKKYELNIISLLSPFNANNYSNVELERIIKDNFPDNIDNIIFRDGDDFFKTIGYVSDMKRIIIQTKTGTINALIKMSKFNYLNESECSFYEIDEEIDYIPKILCVLKYQQKKIGILIEYLDGYNNIGSNNLNNVSEYISLIANFHSKFWNKTQSLSCKTHRSFYNKYFRINCNVIDSWKICLKKYPINNIEQIIGNEIIDYHLDCLDKNTLPKNITLCHGDFNIRNIIEKNSDIKIIDWANFNINIGVSDIGFFLIDSFDENMLHDALFKIKNIYYLKLLENNVTYNLEDYNKDFKHMLDYSFILFISIEKYVNITENYLNTDEDKNNIETEISNKKKECEIFSKFIIKNIKKICFIYNELKNM